MTGRGRLIALLVGMVVVPLVALGVLGHRLVQDNTNLVTYEIDGVLSERVGDTRDRISGFMADRGRALYAVASEFPEDAFGIRSHLDNHPLVGHALVVDREGKRLFPPAAEDARSNQEEAFLARIRTVDEGGVLPTLAAQAARGDEPAWGWHGWYHGGGLNLLFWRAEEQRIVALELPRIQLMSDLVAELPDTAMEPSVDPDQATASDALEPVQGVESAGRMPSRTVLLDAGGMAVYQWGAYEPDEHDLPRASVPLQAPLGAWRLAHYTAGSEVAASIGEGLAMNVVLALVAVALALILLAVYLYRERTREMRLAFQRVSFVNQVSHELKTPLTSIRLYAELLESEMQDARDLADDGDGDGVGDALVSERSGRYLGVIVSESQRLSRLITNVLTFARGQADKLTVRPQPGVVDAVVADAVAMFRPAFEASEIQTQIDSGAPDEVLVDKDALEQILANLLSNVDKYAGAGCQLRLATSRQGDETTITVSDTGPGIPPAHRERIFEPFHRVSDKLADGVTGTGIGLDIARRLARLHGGELALAPAGPESGASFRLTLRTVPVAADGRPGTTKTTRLAGPTPADEPIEAQS